MSGRDTPSDIGSVGSLGHSTDFASLNELASLIESVAAPAKTKV